MPAWTAISPSQSTGRCSSTSSSEAVPVWNRKRTKNRWRAEPHSTRACATADDSRAGWNLARLRGSSWHRQPLAAVRAEARPYLPWLIVVVLAIDFRRRAARGDWQGGARPELTRERQLRAARLCRRHASDDLDLDPFAGHRAAQRHDNVMALNRRRAAGGEIEGDAVGKPDDRLGAIQGDAAAVAEREREAD